MVLSEDGVPVADFILTAYSEDGLSIGHGRTKGDGSFELDLSIADGSVIRIETMSDFDSGSLGVCKAGDSDVALRFVPPRVACLDVRSADAQRTLTTVQIEYSDGDPSKFRDHPLGRIVGVGAAGTLSRASPSGSRLLAPPTTAGSHRRGGDGAPDVQPLHRSASADVDRVEVTRSQPGPRRSLRFR
jgi:hypothetical protein